MSIIAASLAVAFAEDQQSSANRSQHHQQRTRKALIPVDVRVNGLDVPTISLDEGRALIAQAMADYAALSDPDHMLLIRAPAGTGKTWTAVRLAETLAKQGYRVLYLVPRHDFVADILALAQHSQLWLEWQPRRQSEDEAQETCKHAGAMGVWIDRGYEPINLCKRLCEWSYIGDGCPWHAQKKTLQPIVIGQHQHLSSGHPREFDFVIGDEYPLASFAHDWEIPAQYIAYRLPRELDPAIIRILETLQQLCLTLPQNEHGGHIPLSGPDLLNRLGGPATILQDIAAFILAINQPEPYVEEPEDVKNIPYRHIPALLLILDRECRLALTDKPYPHRLIVAHEKMHILQRHDIDPRLPNRCIWLDATADQYLYERVLGRKIDFVAPNIARKGAVYQVWNSTNNKRSLLTYDPSTKKESKTDKVARITAQIQAIIDRGYQRPVVISYKALAPDLATEYGHFGAARGTNQYEGADCLIIVGTPQLAPCDIETEAKMLFYERDDPFCMELTERERAYGQSGQAMLVNGYWQDSDVQALHSQHRDAELIQVAYRGRPLQHAVDIWLLTSHPIEGLSPDKLVSIQEVFMAPNGIDPYIWQRVQKYLIDKDLVTATDLATDLKIDRVTARKLIDLIVDHCPPWRSEKAASRGGRPPKAAKRD